MLVPNLCPTRHPVMCVSGVHNSFVFPCAPYYYSSSLLSEPVSQFFWFRFVVVLVTLYNNVISDYEALVND